MCFKCWHNNRRYVCMYPPPPLQMLAQQPQVCMYVSSSSASNAGTTTAGMYVCILLLRFKCWQMLAQQRQVDTTLCSLTNVFSY
jgi:hypothetical protein